LDMPLVAMVRPNIGLTFPSWPQLACDMLAH
jgi:hypothetical protein